MEESQATEISRLQEQIAAQQSEISALRGRLGGHRRRRWRQVLAWALLLLALLLVWPAEILLWANRTITNTDNYVATVAPIIHEPAVQKAVQKAASDALFASVDVQAYVIQALPDQAKPLAAPLTNQVKSYINDAIGRVVSSDKFAAAWANVNRSAHEQLLATAKNPNANGQINISQLYDVVSQSFAGTALQPLLGKQLPQKVGQINVITVPALQHAPYYLQTLSDSRWLMLGLAVGLMILALAVAVDRRRLAIGIGLGWMAAVLVGLISVRVARGTLLAQIHDPVYQAAASDIWQAVLKPLYLQTVVLFVLGAVIAAIGWLLGPARLATSWRTGLEHLLARGRHRLIPAADSAGWARFMRRYHAGLLWALLLLTIAALLLLAPLTVASLASVIAVAAVVWLVLEFFVAPARS